MSNNSIIKPPSFDSLEHAAKTFNALDVLSAEREAWEMTEYVGSTKRLYNLLARVYAVYGKNFVEASDEERRILRQQLTDKLKAAGLIRKKSTDTLGLLIRFVFKDDRRRTSTYKSALAAAWSHGKEPNEVADWFRQSGGLEEVVRKLNITDKSKNRREKVLESINAVQEVVHNRKDDPLALVTLPVKGQGSRAVLIADCDADGNFKILYVVHNPSEGIQNALYRSAATNQIDNQTAYAVNAAEVNKFINFRHVDVANQAVAAYRTV